MNKEIKILLVDDESDFRQIMTFWLKSKGYLVIDTSDGKSAIKLIKEKNPDIVLLDLIMPVMDGVKTLRRIRKFNNDLPVIIISAYVGDPRIKDATSYGISGVFYKGRDFSEWFPLLESALRTHKKLKK